MNLTQFSGDDLQRITDIVRKKEEHLRAASALDKELAQIGVSGLPAALNGTSVAHDGATLTGSDITQQRLAALAAAGPAGMSAVALADATGSPRSATSAWLSYYKHHRGGIANDGGRWRLVRKEARATPQTGTNRAVILAALQRAGARGLTISDLKTQTELSNSQLRNALYQMLRAKAPVRRLGYGMYAHLES